MKNVILSIALLCLSVAFPLGCADEASDTTTTPASEPSAGAADANGGARLAESPTADIVSGQDSVSAQTPGEGRAPAPTGETTPNPADGPTTPSGNGSGEDCVNAISLSDVAMEITDEDTEYTWTASGALGETDDYNPYMDSGKEPGCSLVYDATGREVVFRFSLKPGERIDVRYLSTPVNESVGALYFLNGCPEATWPDYDGSGMCGNQEYKSQGFCSVGSCVPQELSLTHPELLDDQLTTTQTYWLVLDALGDDATGWAMDWRFVAPQ
mgnify:CR=1 FL=1